MLRAAGNNFQIGLSKALHTEGYEGYKGFGQARDYHEPLSGEDITNIDYIILTLSHYSGLKQVLLLAEQSSLEAAGEKIKHLHPLRFLLYIFSHEQLRVEVKHIGGMAWDEFSLGVIGSLRDESKTYENVLNNSIDSEKKSPIDAFCDDLYNELNNRIQDKKGIEKKDKGDFKLNLDKTKPKIREHILNSDWRNLLEELKALPRNPECRRYDM